MPGETDLHKTLKKEACRWLFRMGYRCIAAEVRLKPLGIIDAVGTGLFRPRSIRQSCICPSFDMSRRKSARDALHSMKQTCCTSRGNAR